MKRLLISLALIAVLVQPALAYRPSGWLYFAYPYSYDNSTGHWSYYDTAGITWARNMNTGSWYTLGGALLSSGWSYWQWPYAYNSGNATWYYIDTSSPQWVVDMTTLQWTLVGAQESLVAQYEASVHSMINNYRTSIGRSALTYNSTIASIARTHSQNMASGAVPFGHDGFDSRVTQIQGYMTITRWSENVQWSNGYADPPYQAYLGWINSAGHYANLTDSAVNTTGVGAAQAANGAWYFTQIFVNRL